MTTIHLKKWQVPPALRGAYSGNRFTATVCERVTLHSRFWDGGPRSV